MLPGENSPASQGIHLASCGARPRELEKRREKTMFTFAVIMGVVVALLNCCSSCLGCSNDKKKQEPKNNEQEERSEPEESSFIQGAEAFGFERGDGAFRFEREDDTLELVRADGSRVRFLWDDKKRSGLTSSERD